jgi:peptidoglycan/LPS O-acetylase OafA/YrhL
MNTSSRKRIDYLDLLRVLAITGVIAFHFLFSAISRGRTPNVTFSPISDWARYGYLGVELFFMITGFVIVQSVANLNFTEFLKKRFVRLYPMYWIALLLIFIISTFGIWGRRGPLAETLYYNLTMFPTAFNQPWMDSAHWFMEKQLQFYLVVAAILLLKAGKQIENIFIWWALVGCFWDLLNFDSFGIWYCSGFFGLIAGGAIINTVRMNGFSQFRIAGLLASFIWAIKSRVDSVAWLDANRGEGHSGIVIGVVVTVIYLLMMLTWSSRITNLSIGWATMAGALSYPIYLIHNRLGGLAIARFGTEGNKYFLYLIVVFTSIFLGYLILRLETRITSVFNRKRKTTKI